MSSNSEVRPLVLWNFELQTSETWMPDHDDKNSCEFYCPGTHGLFKVVRLKPKIHNFLVIFVDKKIRDVFSDTIERVRTTRTPQGADAARERESDRRDD